MTPFYPAFQWYSFFIFKQLYGVPCDQNLVLSVSKWSGNYWAAIMFSRSIVVTSQSHRRYSCCKKLSIRTTTLALMQGNGTYTKGKSIILKKVGCLHPVACTRLGSGFSSNATLVNFQTTETCSGCWIKYSNQCCVRRKPWTWFKENWAVLNRRKWTYFSTR
jgi:hypothetical protein